MPDASAAYGSLELNLKAEEFARATLALARTNCGEEGLPVADALTELSGALLQKPAWRERIIRPRSHGHAKKIAGK